MCSWCVNFLHHSSASIWGIVGSPEKLEFKVIKWSLMTQISYQRNSVLGVFLSILSRVGFLLPRKACIIIMSWLWSLLICVDVTHVMVSRQSSDSEEVYLL